MLCLPVACLYSCGHNVSAQLNPHLLESFCNLGGATTWAGNNTAAYTQSMPPDNSYCK